MKGAISTPEAYIAQLPEARQAPVQRLREVILEHLPEGFEETVNYGMIGYVVPHARYPQGYHCDPKLPLPFMNIASQKNHIALYHNGMYTDKALLQWFVGQYRDRAHAKLDMGKSCIRFKNPEHIPYDLIGELCEKMDVDQWIATYEGVIKRRP